VFPPPRGYALTKNSGFDGEEGWVTDADTLDNEFYNVLLTSGLANPKMKQELQNNAVLNPIFPNQFLWRLNGTDLFMLNADMAVAKDLTGALNPATGQVNCSLTSTCPNSILLPIARQYTGTTLGAARWIKDFRTAFIKITNHGCEKVGVCKPVV
jgi:hypothetical protein